MIDGDKQLAFTTVHKQIILYEEFCIIIRESLFFLTFSFLLFLKGNRAAIKGPLRYDVYMVPDPWESVAYK